MSTENRKRRPKRWVSQSFAERSGQPPSWPRTIEVYCDRKHSEVFIGELRSRRVGPYEAWRPSGPHIETQRLIHPGQSEVRPEVLQVLGMVAHRHIFRCPTPDCRLTVIGGDRLGLPGFDTVKKMVEDPDHGIDREVFQASMHTDAVLSEIADSQSDPRLSLDSLRRILKMPIQS